MFCADAAPERDGACSIDASQVRWPWFAGKKRPRASGMLRSTLVRPTHYERRHPDLGATHLFAPRKHQDHGATQLFAPPTTTANIRSLAQHGSLSHALRPRASGAWRSTVVCPNHHARDHRTARRARNLFSPFALPSESRAYVDCGARDHRHSCLSVARQAILRSGKGGRGLK